MDDTPVRAPEGTPPPASPAAPLTRRDRPLSCGVLSLVGIVALLALLLVGAGLARRAIAGAWWSGGSPEPAITQELVVDRLRDVAKLVSTEMMLRDVVVYENTRFGSTKRALLVVTGKVLGGIDLEKGADVRIDHEARLITIVLPPAEVLAVDVIDIRTYDESAGLLNPFRPSDRDAIRRRIRAQLVAAAQHSGLLAHADDSAKRMLEALLGRDGYSVLVLRPSQLLTPPTG